MYILSSQEYIQSNWYSYIYTYTHTVMYRQFPCALIMLLTIVSLEVFSRLCREHLPEVHAHLESLQILTMLSVSWFLTLFITVMDHNADTGIIDCFFVDGSKVKNIAAIIVVV